VIPVLKSRCETTSLIDGALGIELSRHFCSADHVIKGAGVNVIKGAGVNILNV